MSDRVTPIKLTNHAYWCLGESSLRNMEIALLSDRYIEVEKDSLLPLKAKPISPEKLVDTQVKYLFKEKEFSDGIDNYFFFRIPKSKVGYPPIIIRNDHSGLAIHTNFEGVQLYSDNGVDQISYFHTKAMNHRALAIEPSDSHLSKGMIDKDHPYHRYIFYQFFYNGKD